MTATPSSNGLLPPIHSQVTMKKKLITPRIAEHMLTLGADRNRNVRPLYVDALSRDMLAGDWYDNGEPLRVDEQGVTIDGQHRLLALIAANAQIEMWIASNLLAAAHKSIDSGRIRTAGDVLHYEGEVRVTHLAAALNNLWRYDSANVLTKMNPTRAQIVETLAANQGIRKYVTASGHRSHVVNKSPLATISYVIARDVNEDDADDWLEKVRTDVGHEDGDPCLALRRFALNQKRSGLYVTPVDWMAVCIKSFNAYIEGRTLASVRWRRGGASPEAFPKLSNPQLLDD